MKTNSQKLVTDFRIAGRELFNRFFSIESPWEHQAIAWALVERFNDLESVLFQKLVIEALGIEGLTYGQVQKNIRVFGQGQSNVKALVNRDVDSGYWDFPISIIPVDAEMLFVSFFDWDALSLRDNKYVRVRIERCASSPTLAGKHALLDAQEVSFRSRSE